MQGGDLPVRTNTVVTKVAHDRESTTLTLKDGCTLDADHCLTVPLGVLKAGHLAESAGSAECEDDSRADPSEAQCCGG